MHAANVSRLANRSVNEIWGVSVGISQSRFLAKAEKNRGKNIWMPINLLCEYAIYITVATVYVLRTNARGILYWIFRRQYELHRHVSLDWRVRVVVLQAKVVHRVRINVVALRVQAHRGQRPGRPPQLFTCLLKMILV